jgi:hypothetical protein
MIEAGLMAVTDKNGQLGVNRSPVGDRAPAAVAYSWSAERYGP